MAESVAVAAGAIAGSGETFAVLLGSDARQTAVDWAKKLDVHLEPTLGGG